MKDTFATLLGILFFLALAAGVLFGIYKLFSNFSREYAEYRASLKSEKEAKTLSNEEIIKLSNQCKDGGLFAELVYTPSIEGKYVSGVLCNPQETISPQVNQGKKSQAIIIEK